MPKVVQRNGNMEEGAVQKSSWRVSQCLSFETSGRSHSLPPCRAYVLMEDVALKSPWVEERAKPWISCYGRKEDIWTPTWVSLMDRLNPGSIVRCYLAPNGIASCVKFTMLMELAQLQAVEKEGISDASDITSGWGIFWSNLISKVLLGSQLVHLLLHFMLVLPMNTWGTCVEPDTIHHPQVSNTSEQWKGLRGERKLLVWFYVKIREEVWTGILVLWQVKWSQEQVTKWGLQLAWEGGNSQEKMCVQVCLCVQAQGGHQLFGWARLWSSRPIRFCRVLTRQVFHLSFLLLAETHTEFNRRNKLVSTRQTAHFTVPARLGVKAGSIVSLPDGAEQHKRVSLSWRYTFPCPPLKLRYSTVCVIPPGTVLFFSNAVGNSVKSKNAWRWTRPVGSYSAAWMLWLLRQVSDGAH